MPTPLYCKAVLAADIDDLRGTDDKGYKFEFKDALSEVPYPILGTIHDKENIFEQGVTLSVLKPLMVVVTLVNDSAFAISAYDTITIIVDVGVGESTIIVRLPANTGTAATTYYIDADGNTYSDQALTTPVCGSVVASDTLTLSDALGATYFDVPVSDTLTFENDDITITINNLTIYAEDKLWFEELISSMTVESLIIYLEEKLWFEELLTPPMETTSLIFYVEDVLRFEELISSFGIDSLILRLSDNLWFEETIKEGRGGWEEIASGTSSWVEV